MTTRRRRLRKSPIDKTNVADFCKWLAPRWREGYELMTGRPMPPTTPDQEAALILKWKALLASMPRRK